LTSLVRRRSVAHKSGPVGLSFFSSPVLPFGWLSDDGDVRTDRGKHSSPNYFRNGCWLSGLTETMPPFAPMVMKLVKTSRFPEA